MDRQTPETNLGTRRPGARARAAAGLLLWIASLTPGAGAQVLFDFDASLDGWTGAEFAEVSLAPDVPAASEQSLRIDYPDFGGTIYGGVVTKDRGDHPFYTGIRDTVRGGTDGTALAVDLIYQAEDLPLDGETLHMGITFEYAGGGATSVRPVPGSQILPPGVNQDLVLRLNIPLSAWSWPEDPEWNPDWIRMRIGSDTTLGAYPYAVHYDNIALAEEEMGFALDGVRAVDDGADIEITWPSEAGAVYQVERTLDLLGGAWSRVGSNVAATPPQNVFTHPTAGAVLALYRVVLGAVSEGFPLTGIRHVAGGSGVEITWASQAGAVYHVEWTQDLLGGTWSRVASNIAATPPSNAFTYPTAGADLGHFRVILAAAADGFPLTGIHPVTGGTGMEITWSSEAGAVYRVEGATDPAGGAWTEIAADLAAAPPENAFTNATAGVDYILFRVNAQ